MPRLSAPPSLLWALLLASGCAGSAGTGKNFLHKDLPGMKTVAVLTVEGPRLLSRFDSDERPLKSGEPERIGQEAVDLLRQELADGFSRRGVQVVPGERVASEFVKLFPATQLEDLKQRLRSRPGMGSEEVERLVGMLASLRGQDSRPGENPSPRNRKRPGKEAIDDVLAHGTVDLFAPDIVFDGRLPKLKPVRYEGGAETRARALAKSLGADGYVIAEADYVQRRPAQASQGAVAGCVVWIDLFDARGRRRWEGTYPAFSDDGYGLVQRVPRKEDHLRLGSQALRNAVKAAFSDWDAASRRAGGR